MLDTSPSYLYLGQFVKLQTASESSALLARGVAHGGTIGGAAVGVVIHRNGCGIIRSRGSVLSGLYAEKRSLATGCNPLAIEFH
jgi:hypothetical protein